jgi:hypothetical protein
MDLRFPQGRVNALRLLDPMTTSREDEGRWRELLSAMDEAGIVAFLEGRFLKPEDQTRLDLIKRAKAVGDRCDELGKQIPLNHVDIPAAYDELRRLTWDVEALSLHQLHIA